MKKIISTFLSVSILAATPFTVTTSANASAGDFFGVFKDMSDHLKEAERQSLRREVEALRRVNEAQDLIIDGRNEPTISPREIDRAIRTGNTG